MSNKDIISNESLSFLLENYNFGRYLEDKTLDIAKARAYLTESIIKYANNKNNNFYLYHSSSNEIEGIILFRLSDWDSEHFGFNYVIIDYLIVANLSYEKRYSIAINLLKKFDNYCLNNQIRFSVSKISALDLPVIHALEKRGFNFIETWIYNQFFLKNSDQQNKNIVPLRKATKNDLEIMLDYSNGAFSTQHFHADVNFDVEKADSLYRKWIITAFNDANQTILTGEYDGKPAGYMIYYINDLTRLGLKYAQWKMALLDPNVRGKGFGTDFFKSLLSFHCKEGADIVDSGLSARNLISLNLHNKLNFKIFSTIITFHRWIGPAT